MKRPRRLQSAVSWLRRFDGGSVLSSYCKHYGVDWRCAAVELKQLGAHVDPEYLKRRESSEQQLVEHRKRRRQGRTYESSLDHSHDYDTLLDAYLAKDYTALLAMECERDGVDPESD